MNSTQIEQAIAMLRARVALQIPLRSIPYCEVTGSTLHFLGGEAFERRDEWRDFEAGHGAYGSTEHTPLSLESLQRDLGELDIGQVTPLPIRPLETPRISISELLPKLLSGTAAVRGWSNAAGADLLLGHAGGLLWAFRPGSTLQEVERWEPTRLDAVMALTIPTSAVISTSELPADIAAQISHRLARQDELTQLLRKSPAHFVAGDFSIKLKAGTKFAWVLFEESRNAMKARVVGLEDTAFQRLLGRSLARDPQVAPELMSAAARLEIENAEKALFELMVKLLKGELRYQRNTSLNGFHCWLDGIGYEVGDVIGQATPDVRRNPDLQPDLNVLATMIQSGNLTEQLQPVTPEWRQRVLSAPIHD